MGAHLPSIKPRSASRDKDNSVPPTVYPWYLAGVLYGYLGIKSPFKYPRDILGPFFRDFPYIEVSVHVDSMPPCLSC